MRSTQLYPKYILIFARFIVFVFCLIYYEALAQTPDSEWWQYMRQIEPQRYICQQTNEALEIDGKINESSWANAAWTSYFVDLGPKKIEAHQKPMPVPKFKTRVKMLWDDYYFYVAAELEEPHVWATMLFHDQIICLENNFEIFIDANGDNHNYVEIEINALGTIWDLVLDKPYRDKPKPNQAWNIEGFKKAVSVNGTLNNPKDIDKGWSIEMAIPWSALNSYADTSCPPKENDQWRINFARTEFEHNVIQSEFTTDDVTGNAYQKKENGEVGIWAWSTHAVCNLHTPEMFGYVQFSKRSLGATQWQSDPLTDVRKYLMDIYIAQKDYFKKNDSYATRFNDLSIKSVKINNAIIKPSISISDSGYETLIIIQTESGPRKVSIYQDSKIVVD